MRLREVGLQLGFRTDPKKRKEADTSRFWNKQKITSLASFPPVIKGKEAIRKIEKSIYAFAFCKKGSLLIICLAIEVIGMETT